MNKDEEKEYEKLQRIDKLADQFDQSHRYMLDKSSYSQQDVDYAFSLAKNERSGDAGGDLINNTSGKVYKSLILEKIFGGMKERYLQHIPANRAKDTDAISTWLEEDLLSSINRKKDDFTAVIRALVRNTDSKDIEILKFEFYLIMEISLKRILSQQFSAADGNSRKKRM